jgi:hypothetical protein
MSQGFSRVALPALVLTGWAAAQAPSARLNPTVKQIADTISEQRIASNLKKLESFGTRYVLSSQDDPSHGRHLKEILNRWLLRYSHGRVHMTLGPGIPAPLHPSPP